VESLLSIASYVLIDFNRLRNDIPLEGAAQMMNGHEWVDIIL